MGDTLALRGKLVQESKTGEITTISEFFLQNHASSSMLLTTRKSKKVIIRIFLQAQPSAKPWSHQSAKPCFPFSLQNYASLVYRGVISLIIVDLGRRRDPSVYRLNPRCLIMDSNFAKYFSFIVVFLCYSSCIDTARMPSQESPCSSCFHAADERRTTL